MTVIVPATPHNYPIGSGTGASIGTAVQVNDILVVCCADGGTQATQTATCSGATCTLTNRKRQVSNSGGGTASILSGLVTGAGTPTIAVTSGGGDLGWSCIILRGYASATPDQTGSANYPSDASPETAQVITAQAATIINWWANESGDMYSAATPAGQTLVNHDTGHFDALNYKTGVASGTLNYGITTTGGTGGTSSIVVLAAFYESVGIAFDASSNSGDQSSVSTFTFSRTVTLANPFLALDVGLLSTPNATVTAIDDFGGGNVNIPIIGSQIATGIGLIVQLGLANPVTGTKTIQVNLSASLTSGAVATIYGGVDQIEPTEAFNSAQGVNVGAANASVTITPIVDKTWIHAATSTNDPAATNNQTSRGTVTDAVFGRVLAEDNNAAVTPAAATTMTAAIAAAKAWAIAGYAIRPTGSIDRGLFRIPPMNGLGSGGSFFSNPLA